MVRALGPSTKRPATDEAKARKKGLSAAPVAAGKTHIPSKSHAARVGFDQGRLRTSATRIASPGETLVRTFPFEKTTASLGAGRQSAGSGRGCPMGKIVGTFHA